MHSLDQSGSKNLTNLKNFLKLQERARYRKDMIEKDYKSNHLRKLQKVPSQNKQA